jgi:hypothetical protein
MNKITIVFGVLLLGLAAYGYLGADPDQRSFTALIPAAVGLPLLVCGLLALKDSLRKAAMHVAVVFGLLGALAAGARGLPRIDTLLADDPQGNPRAVVMVLIMFALCTVFVVLCVKSFIDARRRQASQG